jgi:hypothetical protein
MVHLHPGLHQRPNNLHVKCELERRDPRDTIAVELTARRTAAAQVRYLRIVEKSGYQALPWVRYITVAGNYEIRFA